jgi:short-subunit dehydrogenase
MEKQMTKAILVTGAATEFGKDIIWQLAERGHHVYACVETASQVSELKQNLQQKVLGNK